MSSDLLQYSYDGWLVFNELLSTEIFGDKERPEVDDIIESFNHYSEGMPKDSTSGFQRLPIEQDLARLDDLSHQLTSFSEELRAFRYIDENWVEQWGYTEEAEEKMFYRPNHDQVDIFWDTARNTMMMRGDAQLLEQKRKDIRGALSENLKLDKVEFDNDFFLWLLYKEYESGSGELDSASDLHIRKLTRGETVGSAEESDERVQVQGKDDLLKSVVMLVPVLGGQSIGELQGKFILGSKQVEAKISYGGRVHVLVTDNPMSSWEDARKMGLSVLFLSKLINIYQRWENLDSDHKYPPPSFFDDLRENADSEGWHLRFDPQKVKQEYRRKREGVVSDDDSDGDPARV